MNDVVSGIRTLFKSSTRLNNNKNVIIRGYPFDLGTTNRPGARFGPAAIRDASLMLCDGIDNTQWVDLGDLPLGGVIFDIPQSLNLIQQDCSNLIAKNKFFVALGGDHTISYPLVKTTKEKLGLQDFNLLLLDAHSDTWDKYNSIENHGTWLRSLIKEKVVNPDNVYMFGIRAPVPKLEKQWLEKNIKNIYVNEKALIKSLNKSDLPTYLSIDIDCLDPSQAPGTGTPEVCGLQTSTVCNIIKNINTKLIGLDLVEVCPAYDVSSITALAASTIILNTLQRIQQSNGTV